MVMESTATEEITNAYKFDLENLKGGDDQEDMGSDERIMEPR